MRPIESAFSFNINSNHLNFARFGANPLAKITSVPPINKDYLFLNQRYEEKELVKKSQQFYRPKLMTQLLIDQNNLKSNPYKLDHIQLKKKFIVPETIDRVNLSRIKGRPVKYTQLCT